jgi:CBS domain containing-hemolysin-like protein
MSDHLTDTPIRILILVALIAVNGFFAAAEVSLVSVRKSRLRQMAAEGQAGAAAALSLLADPGRLLSVTQVGVTAASLGLGWAGEDTMHGILLALLGPLVTPFTAPYLHGAALALSFLIISYFHVVMGEVVPKNIAIASADRLAVLVAPALLAFRRLSIAFVVVVEGSSRTITRALGIDSNGHSGGHSAEELKLIVSSSRGQGYLPEAQEDMIHRVLDLGDIAVREVMVPRNDIVYIPSDATLDAVLRVMIEQRHSRFPVYEGTPARIVGILHCKDLLPVWEARRLAVRGRSPMQPFHVGGIVRPHIVVPETKPLSQMLEEFRQGHSHMAMVVDEFGTIVGLLTVENVLEQLVGRIEDEHDERVAPRPVPAGDLELDGATRIRDLESEYGIAVPTDAGFETLAGFLLFRLGEIPSPGSFVEYAGRRYTVLEMERNRIARVRVERLREPAAPPPG